MKALKHDFSEDGTSLFFNDVLIKEKVLPNETVLIDDSEDKENRLSNYGIKYRRIGPSNTLVDELRNILSFL